MRRKEGKAAEGSRGGREREKGGREVGLVRGGVGC